MVKDSCGGNQIKRGIEGLTGRAQISLPITPKAMNWLALDRLSYHPFMCFHNKKMPSIMAYSYSSLLQRQMSHE